MKESDDLSAMQSFLHAIHVDDRQTNMKTVFLWRLIPNSQRLGCVKVMACAVLGCSIQFAKFEVVSDVVYEWRTHANCLHFETYF